MIKIEVELIEDKYNLVFGGDGHGGIVKIVEYFNRRDAGLLNITLTNFKERLAKLEDELKGWLEIEKVEGKGAVLNLEDPFVKSLESESLGTTAKKKKVAIRYQGTVPDEGANISDKSS